MFSQKLIIVIINYGTPEYVQELISNFVASLPRFPKIRIDWVVTDAQDKFELDEGKWEESMKKTFKNKKRNFFHFFRIPNRGFAHNVNLGLNLFWEKATPEYQLNDSDLILLINPDTSLYWANLEKAVIFMDKTPEAAVTGLALTGPSGQLEKWGHSTKYPSLKLFFGHKRFSEPSLSDNPTPVAWVSGGAMMIRASWWQKVKGLDQNFYFYFEDVDFCRRVKDNGGKIYFLPDAIVNHRRGGSDITIYQRKKHFYAAEARYFHLYHPPTEYLLLRLMRFPYKIFYFFRCYLVPSFWKAKFKIAKESISCERKEGFPRFCSFAAAFTGIPFLKGIWLATIATNLILLGGAIWGRFYLFSPVILHYNAYLGIDLYGDTTSFFLFPLMAFLVLLFNFILSLVLFFSKRYSNFTILPAGATLAFQLTLTIALLNLLIVNN